MIKCRRNFALSRKTVVYFEIIVNKSIQQNKLAILNLIEYLFFFAIIYYNSFVSVYYYYLLKKLNNMQSLVIDR